MLSAISRTARCTMALRGVALARQRRIIARRPARAPAAFERDDARRARGFALGGAEFDLKSSNMLYPRAPDAAQHGAQRNAALLIRGPGFLPECAK